MALSMRLGTVSLLKEKTPAESHIKFFETVLTNSHNVCACRRDGMSQPLYIPTCCHRWYLHITEKAVTSLPSDEFLCAWKPSAANSAIAYAFDYCLCSMTMFQAKDSRGPTILQHSVLDPTILFWVSSHETPLITPSHTMVHQEGSYISLVHRDLATSFKRHR